MPAAGLIECDADEVAAQIFDGGIVSSIALLLGHNYNNRVVKSLKQYYEDMMGAEYGRLDLDGLCP